MSAPPLEVRGVDLETLIVVRAMVGAGSAQALGLLQTARPEADGLSAAGVLALRRTLGMGLVLCLAQGGGARREHFSAPGGVPWRLWNRHAPPTLTVTTLPIRWVQWALRQPLAASEHGACALGAASEAGDIALVYLLARLLVEAGLRRVLVQRVFRDNPLVRLAWPDALVGLPPLGASDFRRFVRCQSVLIEGFHRWLGEQILEADAVGGAEAAAVVAVAESRRATYAAWLGACQEERRLDLALPLVDAAIAAMRRPPPVSQVDPSASARDRSAAARAGTVLADQAITLAACLDQLGNLDFFDEGYAEAQRLRHRWAGLERVRGIASGRIRDVAGV